MLSKNVFKLSTNLPKIPVVGFFPKLEEIPQFFSLAFRKMFWKNSPTEHLTTLASEKQTIQTKENYDVDLNRSRHTRGVFRK